MILIADSGSTKTDWTLIHSPHPMRWDVIATFQSQGITPIHQTPDEIRQILARELMSQLSTFPRAALINSKVLEGSLLSQISVFFYGSGCTPAHVPMMKQILSEVFSPQNIEVHSDLTAAARALCQYEPGIACILGTGANSCLYDGKEIISNTSPLGFILGDEGSGAFLGKILVGNVLKKISSPELQELFLKRFNLTPPIIINKVYREPMPNRFLATTSLYIKDHIDNPLLCDLVVQNFRQFFRSNIVPYQHPELPVHFVGSMAFIYRDQLVQAAEAEGFHVGHTLQSPMEGLVMYHEKGIDATY